MHTPLILKIKIALALAIAAALFAFVAWPATVPADPTEGLTISLHAQPIRAAAIYLALALVATILAYLVGRTHGSDIAMAAAPAGLTALALFTPETLTLLLHYRPIAGRASLLHHFMADAGIWFLIVLIACLLAKMLPRVFKRSTADQSPAPNEKPHTQKKPAFSLVPNPCLNGLLALSICTVTALIVLKLTAVSGKVYLGPGQSVAATVTPQKGQIVFAVAAALFLGALAAHQLAHPKLAYLLPTPLIVAFLTYALAARQEVLRPLVDAAGAFVPASHAASAILPVQFIGIGTLALLAGFWTSRRSHRNRRIAAQLSQS